MRVTQARSEYKVLKSIYYSFNSPRSNWSLQTNSLVQMSSRAARKRVQPLNLGPSTSSFFRKPNASVNAHSSTKRARVSKSHTSGTQPPHTIPASLLFTFTHALDSTLPNVLSGDNHSGSSHDGQPGTVHDTPLPAGDEEGPIDPPRAGKVFGNSRR
jgi:hypothetical protein